MSVNLHQNARTTSAIRHQEDGKICHLHKATRPEPRQLAIYQALDFFPSLGKTEKTLIDPAAEVTQM